MTEIILYKLGNQRVNKHFMNPRKCLNTREKGNTCIAKLTLVQICFSIHLLWFRLMLPPWETWQRSYHFRGSPIHPFLSCSHGPDPRVSSSLLWPRLPNWPLPLSILFIHINPPCRSEGRDYWSMGLMLKNTVILHCPRHTAQAPGVASNVRAHNAPEASLAPHLGVWETPGQGSSPVGPSTLVYLVIVSMAQFVTSNGSNIKMCELFTF